MAQLTFIDVDGVSDGDVKIVCAGSAEPVSGRETLTEAEAGEKADKARTARKRFLGDIEMC